MTSIFIYLETQILPNVPAFPKIKYGLFSTKYDAFIPGLEILKGILIDGYNNYIMYMSLFSPVKEN